MNVSGRRLHLEIDTGDVRILQSKLSQIGIDIDAKELDEATFGPSTREAIIQLQKDQGLDPTGVVDFVSLDRIAQLVAAFNYVVHGSVSSSGRAGVGGLRVTIVDKNVGTDVTLG